MAGSSVVSSTKSAARNSPGSTGGAAASASGNNSATGRTGLMWKTCGVPAAGSRTDAVDAQAANASAAASGKQWALHDRIKAPASR